MSTTPRTDEAVRLCHGMEGAFFDVRLPTRFVTADFARQLETELATERQKRERAESDAAAMREALYSADDDIREHLQVCKYNLRGQINTGEIIEKPNPPMLVHEAGIAASEKVVEKIRAALTSTAGAELLSERDALRAEVERLRGVLDGYRGQVDRFGNSPAADALARKEQP